MRKIRDIISKPSEALQAMVDGLRESKNWKGFVVDMSTFGSSNYLTGVCYGCAATCAVHKLAEKTPDPESIRFIVDRSSHLQFYLEDLNRFENAIDCARRGELYTLFSYFHLGLDHKKEFDGRWYFRMRRPQEAGLAKVEKLIGELKELGL